MSLDFSIIISTHNRAAGLRDLIAQLSRQDLGPYQGELIIIDNASSDETESVLRDAQAKIPLVHLAEPSPGKNKALNLGIKHARGGVFIFTDDDVIPCDRWVFHLMQGAAAWPNDSVFCGPIMLHFPDNTPSWVRELPAPRLLPLYCRFQPIDGDSAQPIDDVPFGANLAIRAGIFRDRTYDETVGPQGQVYAMGSETELLLRLREHGLRFIYLPSAEVQHIVREDQVVVPWMLRRAYNYGRGRARRALRSDPDRPQPTWRDDFKLSRLWAKQWISSWRSEPQRFAAGWAYHQFRGFLAESRGVE